MELGDDCVIGACSLVTKSVPSGEVWGVPAHFISTTEDYAKKTRHDMLELDLDNFRKNKKDELLRVLK